MGAISTNTKQDDCYAILYVVLKERLWKYVRLRMSMIMVDTTVRHKNNI